MVYCVGLGEVSVTLAGLAQVLVPLEDGLPALNPCCSIASLMP